MSIAAVITADIVNSTTLDPRQEKTLMAALAALLKPYPYEFYRGDSFQVYVKDPLKALELVLKIRAAARAQAPLLDVRASLGIAIVNTVIKKLSQATDPAFVLSGREFDEMSKSDTRLSIKTTEAQLNAGLKVVADFGDHIFQRLTSKQAAVVTEMLQGKNQQEIARKLKKSQSTVNKHVQAAAWSDITKLLAGYREILSNH